MTMPFERTRAFRWTGEILKGIQTGKITDLKELNRQAKVILRHYSGAYAG